MLTATALSRLVGANTSRFCSRASASFAVIASIAPRWRLISPARRVDAEASALRRGGRRFRLHAEAEIQCHGRDHDVKYGVGGVVGHDSQQRLAAHEESEHCDQRVDHAE